MCGFCRLDRLKLHLKIILQMQASIRQKHQIVLNVEVTVRILMPGYTSSVAVDSSLAVAETVIVGSVPDTYTYFNSDSVDDVRNM